jgi:hypothetical protein
MLKLKKNKDLRFAGKAAKGFLSAGLVISLLAAVPALAEERGAIKRKQNFSAKPTSSVMKPARAPAIAAPAPIEPVVVSNVVGSSSGVATTETEVFADRSVAPMLRSDSVALLQNAVARYEMIAAQGGWPQISAKRLKKGSKGPEIVALKRRLIAEGYLKPSALETEAAGRMTDGTQRALMLFQKRNGLAKSGKLDTATVAALNVSAEQRLATLRTNLARMGEYSKGLGPRYIIANVPALQLEAVNGGKVFSRHNIVAGKPERPTPVTMTSVSEIIFNPYWNVPVSIVEKDLIPRILKEGVGSLTSQNIRVFDGYGGPEIDPNTVDWATTPPDRYFFRQDPGEDNAMASVKINFPSPFGIYLHDTPLRSLFTTAARYVSSGCIRVDKVQILVNWILNGQDGWNSNRIDQAADSPEPIDVKVVNQPQLRVVYLTAWVNDQGPAHFRPDIYDLDGTGFVVGQPLPPNEYSETGERFVLKAPPRPVLGSAAASQFEDDGGLFDGASPTLFKRKPRPRVEQQSLFRPVRQPAAKKPAPPSQNFANATFKKKPVAKKQTVAALAPDKKTTAKKQKTVALAPEKKPAKKAAKPTLADALAKKKPPADAAALETVKKKKKKVIEAASTNFTAKPDPNGPTFGQ